MNNKSEETECNMILDYIMEHGSINPAEAFLELGCYRLSARIKDLRDEGYDIVTVMEQKNGKRYARYKIGRGSLRTDRP